MFLNTHNFSLFCKNCLSLLGRITKKIILTIWYLLLLTLVVTGVYNIFINKFNLKPLLFIFDEYIKLILVSWPAVVLLIVFLFIYIFNNEISSFINNIWKIKWGNFEASQREKDQTLETETTLSESSDFENLNSFLVPNSKFSLVWFNNNTSTQDNYVANYRLQGQLVDPIAEKQVIFSVLLANKLIEADGILFKASKKGQRFLKHIKLIQ